MNRFFIDFRDANNRIMDIQGEDAIHILRVLRLKVGDSIEVCDGKGQDYDAAIIECEKNWLRVSLSNQRPSLGEPKTRVTLYQGIPKGSKMDSIIQKCVELGIHRIVPVITARTVVDFSRSGKEEKKVDRWQRIAEEAAKQSRRGIIPKVEIPIQYREAVESASHIVKLIPWEEEHGTSLRACMKMMGKEVHDIAIMIGSEGGFEDKEVALAMKWGWHSVTLGPRILRTETAGMAVLSAIMFHMEEME